jgi:hypothetical protein
MTSEQFVYWLQGYFEVSGATSLTEDQVKIVNDHLKLVLTKVTTNYGSLVGSGGITYGGGTVDLYNGSSPFTITC